MRLFLLFLLVPLIEIFLFIQVGGVIGTWPTIGIVLLTAFAGSWLMRHQGIAALREMQTRLAAGDTPSQLLAEGAMILFAGALLLTPGFFTDAVGLSLLLPPVRRALWHWLSSRITLHTVTAMHGGPRATGHATWHFASDDGVVDGEYTEVRQPRETANTRRAPRLDERPEG